MTGFCVSTQTQGVAGCVCLTTPRAFTGRPFALTQPFPGRARFCAAVCDVIVHNLHSLLRATGSAPASAGSPPPPRPPGQHRLSPTPPRSPGAIGSLPCPSALVCRLTVPAFEQRSVVSRDPESCMPRRQVSGSAAASSCAAASYKGMKSLRMSCASALVISPPAASNASRTGSVAPRLRTRPPPPPRLLRRRHRPPPPASAPAAPGPPR